MARSIVNQGLYLQKEPVPGTAIITALKRYLGIKGTVGWDISREKFQASGYKATTGQNTLTEVGKATMTVVQDYNAMLPLLSGVFGAPVTTALDVGPPAAYQHVFTINPKAADTLVTFTAMWGDPTFALQATNWAFHGMTIGAQRTQLSLSANAILRSPVTGIALPGTGITEVPMVPVRASTINGYLDDAWADLGTTQIDRLYGSQLQLGDKLAPDWVLNSTFASFSELLENEGISYTQSLDVAFDAAAVTQIAAALNEELSFLRISSVGPDINGTDAYGMDIDTCVSLVPDMVDKSANSNAVAAKFTGELIVDPVSSKFAQVTLINTLAAL